MKNPTHSKPLSKVFKAKVENQLDRKIKMVRSDRGGEFYGRYDETGRNPGPFARFLEENGIIAQYTMPGTPQQNGVAERRNRPLMDMGGISKSFLPESGEAFLTAMYIRFLVRQFLKHLLNCGKDPAYHICMFGDVQLRLGFTTHMKGS